MKKTNIDLLKKIQREKSEKKRKEIKKISHLNNVFFYKILGNYVWFKNSKIIASFLSIKSEICTYNINKFILDSEKVLCLPVIETNKNNSLVFKKYLNDNNLITGKYGIKEPKNNTGYNPDIIFVPCLAYDMSGFRLGYGGGYYDRYIRRIKKIKKILTIGLAFSFQKVKKLPLNFYDEKLDFIITENYIK